MIHVLLAMALGLTPVQSRGQSLFAIHCSSCHGLALQGGPDGPPLFGKDGADLDFMLQTGRMPAAITGEQQVEKTPQLSQSEIGAIVAYVTSKGHASSQLPHLASGDAERGREIFAENCAQCHGVSAHGASVGYGTIAPSLMQTRPEQIAEAIRSGPGQMPRFGPDVIAERDLDDLVSYVEFLQQRKAAYNPGGLQLANIGPVAEGFVAWVFGLGILALFIRRIGSTD